jgi:opacity protein-like surface antigen
MKKILLVLMVMGLLLSSGPVWAKDGFYLGMDLGVAVAPDMDVQTGGFDDWTTTGTPGDFAAVLCDTEIFPERPSSSTGYCGEGAPQEWGAKESFDGGSGILAGLAVGYRLGSFRVEGEYFYRGTRYGSTAEPGFPDSTQPDGVWYPSKSSQYGGDGQGEYGGGVEDAVDNLMSHNVFANLYYDYRSDSKFTPYVGIGIGLARVSVGYRTLWQRTTDPAKVADFETEKDDGTPDEVGIALNQSLAGTTTYDRAKMSDTLFGYQALAGVDYQVSEPLTIGLKFRYADFGEFEAESAYTKLRGHESVAGNPPVPVTYYIRTDDIQFWGVSLNMKYQF